MDFNAAVNNPPYEAKTYTPEVVDPMDPTPLVKGFDSFTKKIGTMAAEADKHQVTDDASNAQAVEMIGQVKKLSNAIEKKRKQVTEPYHFVKKTIDGHCKPIKDSLLSIQRGLESKIRPYLNKKEQERREAERKAQEEAARVQRELKEKARQEAEKAAEEARKKAEAEGLAEEEVEREARKAAAQVEEAPVIVAESVPEETKTKTDSGTAALKKEWVWELEDFTELPEEIIKSRWEYIVKAIAPAINARVKAGIRTIPGVKIFKQATVKTSVRR